MELCFLKGFSSLGLFVLGHSIVSPNASSFCWTMCVVACTCVCVVGRYVSYVFLIHHCKGQNPPHSLGGHKDLPTHCLVQSPYSLLIPSPTYSCIPQKLTYLFSGTKAFLLTTWYKGPYLAHPIYKALSALCVAHSMSHGPLYISVWRTKFRGILTHLMQIPLSAQCMVEIAISYSLCGSRAVILTS